MNVGAARCKITGNAVNKANRALCYSYHYAKNNVNNNTATVGRRRRRTIHHYQIEEEFDIPVDRGAFLSGSLSSLNSTRVKRMGVFKARFVNH